MEDNTPRQAIEDISFIKKIIANSQVQFSILSKFFIIVAIFEIGANLFLIFSIFFTKSTEQRYTINSFVRIFNLVTYCILAIIFIKKRITSKKSRRGMTIHFMELWGIVLLIIPAIFYIMTVIIGLTGLFFNFSTAFEDGYITIYVQLTIKIVSLCFALIATGMILDNRLINGYGIAILVIYLLTFVFPRSIEIRSILGWIPGRTSTISLIPQSIFTAIVSPVTYFIMGFYVKNKVGDVHGDK